MAQIDTTTGAEIETYEYECSGETYTFERRMITQLSAVREIGAVNMSDAYGVYTVAEKCGFDALAEYLESDRSYYHAPAEYIYALGAMAEFDRAEGR